MPIIGSKGAESSGGFGQFAKTGVATYIEDVFSTYLYTGTGAAQTITNNIDLSTKGGLVWIKSRSAVQNNNLFDTTQGATKLLHSNTGDSTLTGVNTLTAFNTTGFTLGTGNSAGLQVNTSAETYVSWTFRKQPKFFDIVTWTGSGTPGRTISHSLGSVPGCIMVKCTSTTYSWFVYHKDAINGGGTSALNLSTTAATTNEGNAGIQNLTTTTFQLGGSGAYSTRLDDPSATYIAYIFASDAGGFGLTGTDNVITCGSYTGNGSATGPSITLGYEPQWVLVKNSTNINSWVLEDVMRRMSQTSSNVLAPNQSSTESALNPGIIPNATGFSLGTTNGVLNTSGDTYIYIAIRRGPMKVPTLGTSVFSPNTWTSTTGSTITTNFPVDLQLIRWRGGVDNNNFIDRLRGMVTTSTSATSPLLATNSTSAESSTSSSYGFGNTSFLVGPDTTGNGLGLNFQRAPSFFDEVCYTGTGTARTVTHNLAAVPELMIVKTRSTAGDWIVYSTTTGNNYTLYLDGTVGQVGPSAVAWNNTTPTSSVFTVGTFSDTNASGVTFVAYLFASCPGVSKVGSYTGNGTTQTINCGFTGGVRFVLIKRTDAAGDWYVYDTARGMTTLTDPYLLMNSSAAETATLGSVTTVSTGFAVNASILAAINTNAATYIFLAIA